ncbi:MAG: methionyl-tRNA formyltransferase [Pyrinomonadaceae bacterium MAG19_C2-C3]|nr:methionyl-tRNA formyltransferase [Pyrinomonadaceae bacterium MAG19_C2-C3]
MGTPTAAVPVLRRIVADGHDVVAVWTRADSIAGRGNKLTAPPVKEAAMDLNLPVYQPTKIKTDEARELFASHEADACVVVAYGRILPVSLLDTPKHGCINVHFSLLPKWRGAAPVNWAVMAGDMETGVTTMQMDEGLDTGDILLQRGTTIEKEETATDLTARLAEMGADLLSETLRELPNLTPRKQEGEASHAPMLTRDMGHIDWTKSANEIERRVRGLQPSPLAFTTLNSRRLIVWRARVVNENINGEAMNDDAAHDAGEIIEARGENLIVRCGQGSALGLIEVQPEGKRRISVRDALNGMRVTAGTKFE